MPAVVSADIVVLAIVPPSTLSPEIWLFASVKVPELTSKVFPEPTVTSEVAIVAPSIVPESISTLEILTSPVPFGVKSIFPLISKLFALIILPGLMLLVLMVVGIAIQTWKGFYDYEISLYLKKLFILDWSRYMLLCVLAFTIQVIVNHKYLGHFLMILYFIFGIFAGQLGLNHTLYYFGSGSGAPYSDMNGLAPYINRLVSYKLYWISFAGLLVILSNLMWVRGKSLNLKSRFSTLKNRVNNYVTYGVITCSISFIFIGSYIFYNTNILNSYHRPKFYERQSADYEKNIKSIKINLFQRLLQ